MPLVKAPGRRIVIQSMNKKHRRTIAIGPPLRIPKPSDKTQRIRRLEYAKMQNTKERSPYHAPEQTAVFAAVRNMQRMRSTGGLIPEENIGNGRDAYSHPEDEKKKYNENHGIFKKLYRDKNPAEQRR